MQMLQLCQLRRELQTQRNNLLCLKGENRLGHREPHEGVSMAPQEDLGTSTSGVQTATVLTGIQGTQHLNAEQGEGFSWGR